MRLKISALLLPYRVAPQQEFRSFTEIQFWIVVGCLGWRGRQVTAESHCTHNMWEKTMLVELFVEQFIV